jgi:predicted metal-dependent peptidase
MDETKPTRIDVLYADARVAKVDTFERDEDIEFRPAGGGATDFRPVFEAIAAMDEQPVCIIYITDLCGTFPQEASEIPTLWITDTDLVAPFGETVKM